MRLFGGRVNLRAPVSFTRSGQFPTKYSFFLPHRMWVPPLSLPHPQCRVQTTPHAARGPAEGQAYNVSAMLDGETFNNTFDK
jgi:hypothetical protein